MQKTKKRPQVDSDKPLEIHQQTPAMQAPVRNNQKQGQKQKQRQKQKQKPTQQTEAKQKQARAQKQVQKQEPEPSGLLGTWNAKVRHTRRRWRQIHRERRARRFPESDRLPIQLLLLFWSMFPSGGVLLRETARNWKERMGRPFAALKTWFEEHPIGPAAFLGTACGLLLVVLFFSVYTFGTTVLYDGKVVGRLSSHQDAEEACGHLERIATRTLGQTYAIDDARLQYQDGLVRWEDVVEPAAFEGELSDELGVVSLAYCLYVDGELVGATPYEGALEEVLEQLQSSGTDENTISCTFAEQVEIRQEYAPAEKVMNLGHLAQMLFSTKAAEVTYTVVKGDTWSEIAEDHGMTSKELLALNPGYNIDLIQIGEVLTISQAVPYLTRTVVQREYYIDQIMYDINYTETEELYKGDYKVVSNGEYGAADVTANVTYVNGQETERNLLSYVLLKEPVAEQRLQGTKERPTWEPTGSFRWPVSGHVTSGFGGRSSPGGIGSTNHKGLDIAAPYGTPVYAADGGTVTYAGWMSGYGYLVQIDHGNGYETRYGHNSSLTVSVGEHVYKGQQIARVGSTGNSTGNHCHFEVRLNGTARNPRNYL